MNPIYRFELSQNGTNTRAAKPNYNNDLSIEYALEQNEEFYRGKLSGKLTFQQDDYAYIKNAAFDTQFDVVIFISYDAGLTWAQYWKGKFFKTDCEFNDDDQTAIVTPSLNDQYNDVLAGLEKEYNLIDLAPVIQPIKYDKRPMIQVYVPGQSVIGCFLSGMWWEQECEPVDDETVLEQQYHFSKNKTERIIDVVTQGTPQIPDAFNGPVGSAEYVNGNYKVVTLTAQGVVQLQIVRVSDDVVMWFANVTPATGEYTLQPAPGSGATGNVTLYIHDISVFARYVTDVESAFDVSAYPIPDDDIVPNNRNYHYVLGYYFPDSIVFYSVMSTTPTKWGLYQPGEYYKEPYVLGGGEFYPIARAAWGRVSLWFTFYIFDWVIEREWRKEYTLKDAFPISSVISVLLGQISQTITHDGTTDYSAFLYAENNPISNISQTLFITPKSNIINSGYDQPAQKAQITLRQVLNMLRDCFRCYWFIDDDNRFRIEHISWFMRGGSYTGTPVVGIDLTKEIVTRNGKPWSYARNQYQFDKPDMAARYQFGWMDDVTELFDGYPIDIISKYVNPDNIEQIDVSQFTSDVDYILLNPGAVSKDGFVLFGATPLYSFVRGVINGRAAIGTDYVDTLENSNICLRSQLKDVVGGSISVDVYGSGYGWGLGFYDSNRKYLGWSGWNWTNATVPTNAAYYLIMIVKTGYAQITPDEINNVQILVNSLPVNGFGLPYVNFVFDGTNYILQNAWVAFIYLQQYYLFDMPARNVQINGVTQIVRGIKKLKTQTIKFPVLTEPDMFNLIKTGLGNGTIQRMSVNLSSRNANTTLKYDTE